MGEFRLAHAHAGRVRSWAVGLDWYGRKCQQSCRHRHNGALLQTGHGPFGPLDAIQLDQDILLQIGA